MRSEIHYFFVTFFNEKKKNTENKKVSPAETVFNKKEVIKGLKNGLFYRLPPPSKYKSAFWESFEMILKTSPHQPINFVV